jgi:high-affinity iron transporter
MNEFIIMFREGLEASLIVGIIYTLLIKQELNREIRQLWLGVGAAIVASIITGFALVQVKSSIGNASIEALFEGVAMIATCRPNLVCNLLAFKASGRYSRIKRRS